MSPNARAYTLPFDRIHRSDVLDFRLQFCTDRQMPSMHNRPDSNVPFFDTCAVRDHRHGIAYTHDRYDDFHDDVDLCSVKTVAVAVADFHRFS